MNREIKMIMSTSRTMPVLNPPPTYQAILIMMNMMRINGNINRGIRRSDCDRNRKPVKIMTPTASTPTRG
jgi:hypothetical protein